MKREKISLNFYRDEFACKCDYQCNQDTVDAQLLKLCEQIRAHFCLKYNVQVYMKINSGNRCILHNLDEGGSEKSFHLFSKACDFVLYFRDSGVKRYIEPKEIAEFIDSRNPDKYGIGVYNNPGRNHVDVGMRRWRSWE